LQKRAASPDQVSADEYDTLETVDHFFALLETTLAHNPESLSAVHLWMIESTFDIYWMNTVMADRPDLGAYMVAHWPRLTKLIEDQRARRGLLLPLASKFRVGIDAEKASTAVPLMTPTPLILK
jgi:hypothetical protein